MTCPERPRCFVCGTEENVETLTLRATNGLHVEHPLCVEHLERWIFSAATALVEARIQAMQPAPEPSHERRRRG